MMIRETVTQKIIIFFKQVLNWLKRFFWIVFISGFFLIVFLEIFEALHKNEPLYDPFHILELFLYVFMLALVGVLIKYLVEANAAQNHIMKILDYKHNISMDLTKSEDWETFTTDIVRVPSMIADVEASRLYVNYPHSGQLQAVAFWNDTGSGELDFFHDCYNCLKELEGVELLFSPCRHATTSSTTEIQSQEYCLPLSYANHLLAWIQFRLKPGETLAKEQIEIFESIRYEMSLALKANLEHKRNTELRLTEMALAERHSISTYLHDNLSQNLAYLCLKLDQFTSGNEPYSVNNVQTDLQRMKDAANQSYDIVRGMLETIHPATTPHFVNLITAFAKKVSQRADIEITIDKNGMEVPVLPEIQQTIFYVFQEVLSNVEKHARADKVKVLIDWGEDNLTVTVSDNGIGFDPQNIDRTKHFGMEIMQERIDKVNGRVDIRSSTYSGTEIIIFIPIIVSQEKER